MNRTSWFTWSGLSLVLMAAAVLSFSALRDLAVAVDIPIHLAWLLPIAVDAGAAVSCAAWLSTSSSQEVARFARSLTWALLGLTVVANAAAQGMTAAEITPPWWAAVLVGAIPPGVLGAVVHLAVLAGRQGDTGGPQTAVTAPIGVTGGAGTPRTAPDEGAELSRTLSGDGTEKGWVSGPIPAADHGYTLAGTPAPGSNRAQPGPTADDLLRSQDGPGADRAAALIAEGAGRRRLAAELQISEHAARELLAERRNGHRAVRS